MNNTVTTNTTSDQILTLRANPPVLMNERELAIFLGISERSVRNYTNNGLIPVIRVGRRKIYRRDAVLSAVRKQER